MKILKNKLILLQRSKTYKIAKMAKLYIDKNSKQCGILILTTLIANMVFCYFLDKKINFFGIVFRVYLVSLGIAVYFKKINSETFTKSQILNNL